MCTWLTVLLLTPSAHLQCTYYHHHTLIKTKTNKVFNRQSLNYCTVNTTALKIKYQSIESMKNRHIHD
jgi:hypothetical protein